MCIIKEKLVVSGDDVKRIEAETRNQSADDAWFKHRIYRITASKAYRCAVLKESTSPTKTIKEVLGYNKIHSTRAMKEGLSQEKTIISDYVEDKNTSGANVTVQNCGFFVSSTNCFLGTSPDGVVIDMAEETSGLLQMKYVQTI